jgi:hypothetical protein
MDPLYSSSCTRRDICYAEIMRRVGKNIRPYLDKARDSALLAVEVYNKPAIAFRSSGYIALMVIAWTSLLHAIFVRRRTRPYHRKGNHFEMVDGDYKHWELKECAKQYWGSDTANAVRKNIEFFIPLRNKIEHRHIPPLDADIFGECQALLLNFDALIGAEFGEKYCLRESLSFALQLFPTGESLAAAAKTDKKIRDVRKFVETYRSTITAEAMNSGQFAFKAFLIQVANHPTQDTLAIQFVQYDKLTPEQKEEVSRIPALIKLKQGGVVNADLLKAGDVAKAVQKALGNPMMKRGAKTVQKFTTDAHTRCWKRYNVRPSGGVEKPAFTDERFCSYDSAHRDYLYTKAWVAFLVDKMNDDSEYKALYPER